MRSLTEEWKEEFTFILLIPIKSYINTITQNILLASDQFQTKYTYKTKSP